MEFNYPSVIWIFVVINPKKVKDIFQYSTFIRVISTPSTLEELGPRAKIFVAPPQVVSFENK